MVVREGDNMSFFNVIDGFGKKRFPSLVMTIDVNSHWCTGAAGGSEEWEFRLGIRCGGLMKRNADRSLMCSERQSLLDIFNSEKKKSLGPGTTGELKQRTVVEVGRHLHTISMGKKMIDETWEASFQRPLDKAECKIEDTKKMLRGDVYLNKVLVVASGRSCLRLVCDPYYFTRTPNLGNRRAALQVKNCYDLIDFPECKEFFTIRLSLTGGGNEVRLRIRTWTKKSKRDQGEPWARGLDVTLPTYFDCGKNIIQVGEPLKTLHEICPEVPQQQPWKNGWRLDKWATVEPRFGEDDEGDGSDLRE